MPDSAIPLRNVTVTVRPGGTTVFAAPDSEAKAVGELVTGAPQEVRGVLFGECTWLSLPWASGSAWIPGEDTDFARSPAYNQVVTAWYESAAVLAFRRAVAADLLSLRGTDEEPVGQPGYVERRGAARAGGTLSSRPCTSGASDT